MSPTLPPALLPELLDHVLAQWPALFAGQRQPHGLDFVLQGTGVGKVIAFVLPRGSTRPCCLLKVPRSERDSASLAHELQLVQTLRQRGGHVAAASLPEPLAAPVIQGWQTVVEKILPGHLFSRDVPVGARFTLDLARQHLRLVRDWYVGLVRAVYPEHVLLSDADVQALFVEPINLARSQAELHPHEFGYLDQLERGAAGLVGRPWQLAFAHGDLRAGNILLAGNQPRVIDWQMGRLRHLPLLDWFEFAFRYFCDAHDVPEITGALDDYRAAFADVFLGAHPYSGLLAEETALCAETLGVGRDQVDLLLGMWLVDNTNKYMAFLGDRADHGYLYLMQDPPGGPFRTFRQQLRRQVYTCLLGQLSQDRGATRARPQTSGFWAVLNPLS